MKLPCRCSTQLFLFVENTSSKNHHSTVCQNPVRTRGRRRRVSPDREIPRMKTRGSEPEPCNTSLEEMRMTIAKRKVRHDGEGPANKNKKKGFDLSDKGNEASTSSTVGKGTGGLISSNIITKFKNVRF